MAREPYDVVVGRGALMNVQVIRPRPWWLEPTRSMCRSVLCADGEQHHVRRRRRDDEVLEFLPGRGGLGAHSRLGIWKSRAVRTT